MDINKNLLIESLKLKFNNDIKYLVDSYEVYLNKIDKLIESQHDYLTFINKMKICELLKWEYFKNQYKEMRKNITQINKSKKKVIKSYGNIINYYSDENIKYFNDLLDKINDYSNKLFFNFQILKKHHKQVFNKIKCSKQNNTLILSTFKNEYQDILTQLYELFIDFKILDKKYYLLKKQKGILIDSIKKFDKL